ncbi:hypothetical protein SAMD00019534_122200 [Acytostelium subglobosum LB1]|uniref:hypothetical protein n=1 Tax=Acytostelium subglobosum LB1 TaxID=1410327 RepID=UPI000645040E|nr:hypothetical protein SAMD00019534_122200 [Acytostelium subglobosum LB1]GAM29044.1 hypothetical protein SAMD00019534_122200 [Acytostelium subglobosum LB1]|eukprot:XP_012748050.1 hypothetical protein SAMD00019534_122200 [Acytostelium subglobosum LB1]
MLVKGLPTKLTSLTFGNAFNQELRVGSLPASITTLSFGREFNQPLDTDGILTNALTSLTVGDRFNHIFSKIMACSLTSLTAGEQFLLTEIGMLTDVSTLVLGHGFNQRLPSGSLPRSITELYLGDEFNQSLEIGSIPQSTVLVQFGERYEHPLPIGTIPNSVTHLILRGKWLPVHSQRVATLEIGSFNSARGRGMSLPDSLTSVKIRYCDEMDSQSMPALPPSVTRLIGVHFVSPSKLHSGCITSSVTELSFGQHFRGPLVPGFIPPSVTALSFGPHFRQQLNGELIPTSVTSLSVCFDRLSDLSDLQLLDRLEMSQGTLIRLGKELGKAPLKRPLSKELLVNVVDGEGFTLSMLDIAPTISYAGRINFSFRKISDGLVCLVVFQSDVCRVDSSEGGYLTHR